MHVTISTRSRGPSSTATGTWCSGLRRGGTTVGLAVYYAPSGYSELYWVSSPEAQHSRNLAAVAS